MERCDFTGLSFTSIDLDDYAATCDRIVEHLLDTLASPAPRTLLDDLLRVTALAEHLRAGARLLEGCGAEPESLVEALITPCPTLLPASREQPEVMQAPHRERRAA